MLFRSQLEGADFNSRVLQSEKTDPQIYVSECTQRDFFAPEKGIRRTAQTRARRDGASQADAGDARRRASAICRNRSDFSRELTIASARAIDPLFKDSLMTLARDLPPNERDDLVKARDAALTRDPRFRRSPGKASAVDGGFRADGRRRITITTSNRCSSSRWTRNRWRCSAGRSWRVIARSNRCCPIPRWPIPNPARSKNIPPDQASFLKAYESREQEMINFLKEHQLVTVPDYLGRFEIRQLPEAFKPTSPGGFMNPPGLYDKDPAGFYFIPTYNPQSKNFYIRAAIEDPRPILGHEGIPGHFMQLSIANHLTDEIRRQHGDGVFVEGWALYGEEMLMRTGLYPENSAAHGQVLRLSRYRSARIGVDVNLHTGKWTFEQAVNYFMEGGRARS